MKSKINSLQSIELRLAITNIINMYFNDMSANKLYYIHPNYFKQTFILPNIPDQYKIILFEENNNQDKVLGEYEIYKLIKKYIENIELSISDNSTLHKFTLTKSKNDKVCNGISKIVNSYESEIVNNIDYIIHGSYADNTYNEFSDVDDIIFLNEGVFKSFDNFKKTKHLLSKLNLYYQKVDPLQHHGHWLYTFLDKYDYDQSVMPCSIFNTAIAIGKDVTLDLYVNNDYNNNFESILEIIAQEVKRDTLSLINGKCNLYYLKNLISGISLLVPLSFQVKGEIYDKKTAILKAHELFDDESLEVIRWATMIRQNWKYMQHFDKNIYFTYLQTIFKNRNTIEHITKKFLPNIDQSLVPGFNDIFAKKILNFADSCLELKNEN
ncbi:nucleotidyltransferase domain-containing protein [Methanosarcina sp. 2.H.A.1B.4]|uniref:nucleotidyltransferase domain-containing protein n=1 Tax=Methanosarcina sp. 2.H.A.1B.4 TaxID=1483600 RepID=UPI000622B3EA|nr:nucleotidyltransferase domain-containing protein [Methanosarcina sp. 2.H.A.1B.4]KKG07373.1 hypothetical protein EO92_14970 [Methanosarcina sp. 2.H.A.1B.4]